jgi:hypothetical protein
LVHDLEPERHYLKNQFNLFQRSGVFYCEGAATGRETSLRTRDRSDTRVERRRNYTGICLLQFDDIKPIGVSGSIGIGERLHSATKVSTANRPPL